MSNRTTDSEVEETTTLEDGTVVQYHKNGHEVYTYKNGTIITVRPDGTRIQRNPEGQVHTTGPDGVTRCEYPDGTKLTRLPDGTQETVCIDGTKIEEPVGGLIKKKASKPDGSVIITYRNGRKVGQFADGCVVEEFQGVKTTRKPNGTVILDYLDAGSKDNDVDHDKILIKECTFSDKTVVYTYKSGRTYQIDADGYKTEVLTSGVKRQENPNGTVITSYPDGRKVSYTPHLGVTVTQYTDGRREQIHSDGTKMEIDKDGNAVATRPDGTVIETFEKGPVVQRDRLPDGRVICIMRDGTTIEEEVQVKRESSTTSSSTAASRASLRRSDEEDTSKNATTSAVTKSMEDLDVADKAGISSNRVGDSSIQSKSTAELEPRTGKAASTTTQVAISGTLDSATIKALQKFLNSKWDDGAAIISRGKRQSKRLAYSGTLDNRTVRSLQCFLNSRKEEAKLTLGLLKAKGIFDTPTQTALQRYLNSNWKKAGLQRSKLRGLVLQTKGVKALQKYLNSELSS